MIAKTQNEIDGLKEIGQIVADCLNYMLSSIEEGMTTKELDALGAKFLSDHGAKSAPIYCYNFPGNTCISINSVAAHGIPSDYKIKSGDLINVDVSAVKDGFFGDTGASLPFGFQNKSHQKLCKAARKTLIKTINSIKPGMKVNEVGRIISENATNEGYYVIPDLCSHGIGRTLHDSPKIPPIYIPNNNDVIEKGMAFTIEPFLATMPGGIFQDADGWSLVNSAGFSAQYEHTVIVNENGAQIITHASDCESQFFF